MGWNSVNSSNKGKKPNYDELCDIIGVRARRNEHAEPKENWLRVEWTTGKAYLRVDFEFVDGEYVYVMSEKVGSFD